MTTQLDARLETQLGTRPTEADIRAGRLVAGMSFDERVWALCARIPPGRLATYGQIAAALGSPGAARAVGGALNRNPYAPGVPCHRVVGSTGALTGFAGGLDKKRALLATEGIAVRGERVVEIPRTSLDGK
jgi:methylated-DNA-[protein]-cysteine S-methyltransferase